MSSNKGHRFPIEVLSLGEIGRIINSFPNSRTGIRNRAIVLTMCHGATRCAETLNLRVQDVDFDNKCITIIRGKGGKRRVIGISSDALTAIKNWLTIRPIGNKLFITWKGSPINSSYIRRLMKRVGVRANITKRVHSHGFRHSAAYHMANKGIDLRLIQKQLGHSNLSVTDTYVSHLGDPEVINAISSIAW